MPRKQRAFEQLLQRLAEEPELRMGLAIGLGMIALHAVTPRKPESQENKARRQAAKAAQRARLDEIYEYNRRRRELELTRWAYFESGEGAEALAAQGGFLIAAVEAPYRDTHSFRSKMNAYSVGEGFRSDGIGASFAYSFDGHDDRGYWTLRTADEAFGGGCGRPTERWILGCPEGRGLLTEEQRGIILRLLGASTKIREVRFNSYDRRQIEDRLWQEVLDAHGVGAPSWRARWKSQEASN